MNQHLLKPKEVLDKNPGLKKVWNSNDLGYLLRLGLVRGEKLIRGCIIDEKDVLRLYRLRTTQISE